MRAARRPFPTARPSVSDAELSSAVGFALTGERLRLTSVAELAEQLAAAGYTVEVLTELRGARQAAKLPWPFPVPLEERRAVGFARFDAALADARRVLGLAGLTGTLRVERPLDRDEQRLAADRPPHW